MYFWKSEPSSKMLLIGMNEVYKKNIILENCFEQPSRKVREEFYS